MLFSQGAIAGWTRASANTIELKGDISKDSYQDYVNVARGGFSNVILDSAGGYPSVALKIASNIQDRPDVSVYVKGVCLSACASYLAISGDSLRVDCDSILGYHGDLADPDDEMISMKSQDLPSGLIKEYIGWLKDFHKRELAFYKRSGVDYKIIGDSVSVVKNLKLPSTYSLDPVTGGYSFSTSVGIWVPPFESLRKYGIKGLKYCKSFNHETVGKILKSKGFKSLKFSTEKTR
jgi:hypothetical protein